MLSLPGLLPATAHALTEGGEEVAAGVRAAFEVARLQLAAATTKAQEPTPEALWNAHGRLTERQEHAAARSAWRDVIVPCAQAVLA